MIGSSCSAGDEGRHIGELGSVKVALDLKVVVSLDVDPETVVDAQRLGQPHRCGNRDRPLAADDLADAGLRQSGGLGEPVLGDPERLQELGQQDLTGSDRVVCLLAVANLGPPSVVVGDLYVFSALVGPGEADSVLVVDPDRVLARAVAEQLLEAVSCWHPEAVELGGRVEDAQLLLCCSLQVVTIGGDTLALPDLLGFTVPEGPDHCSTVTRDGSIVER